MKKLIYFCFIFLVLALNIQCTRSSIVQPVYGVQTSSNYYKNAQQINEALTGTYLQLRQTWNEFAKYFYEFGSITTDNAWKGGANISDDAALYNMQIFNVKPTNSDISNYWKILYDLINRANDVIYYAPKASGNKQLLTRYMNEAKLLRAFGYYNLVTMFGGVPLVLKPLTPSETTKIPRASADSVFKQIDSDLEAATALPAKGQYDQNNEFRVTSGLAYTLLGKSYMFQRKYAQAVTALANVVNSGDYALLPDYGANWRIKDSEESVFEIDNELQNGDPSIPTGSNVPHFFTSRNTPGYQGYGFDDPTQDLFNAFDPNDPRITYTFIMNGDVFKGDTVAQDNSAGVSPYAERKIFVPKYLRVGYNYMLDYNVVLIRYSGVLLLYAEALNEVGKSSQALIYLNEVRQRARNTPPLDPERSKQVYIPKPNSNTLPDITTTNQAQLRKIIWHEERVELGMEGWRRIELIRQQRFGQVMRAFAQKYNTPKGANFDDNRDYLLPIPQSEIDNSNGVIKQNPGY